MNRSRPSKDNLAGNIVEGLISGEGIGYDRKGAEYCVEGLASINKCAYYTNVIITW